METDSPDWPLIAMVFCLVALLLLDYGFGIETTALLAFVPVLLWAGVLVLRSRR